MNYPVIGQVKTKSGVEVPLVDILMMSDERWIQIARENAMHNYIREHGRKPIDAKKAYKWQRERFCEECAMV